MERKFLFKIPFPWLDMKNRMLCIEEAILSVNSAIMILLQKSISIIITCITSKPISKTIESVKTTSI